MELQEIREQINEVDALLVPLLTKRMGLSRAVAEAKREQGLPILNKGREREILKKVCDQAGEELEPYMHRIYNSIFEESRAYQELLLDSSGQLTENIRQAVLPLSECFPRGGEIAVQGVEGAYGQMAADQMFPMGNLHFYPSFDDVCTAVEKGECQFGILPIENSSNGTVRAVFELLRRRNVSIVRSTRLCIRHQLMVKPGTKLEDIREIRSHEQAIGQCSEFLKSLGNSVKVTACANTALGAKMASEGDGSVASISSPNCGRLYGLVPLHFDIQNSDNNYTRFVCITRDLKIYPGSDRISLIVTLAHKPGALYEILSKFTALELNLMKLESYPIIGHDFEFMFFFEVQANVNDRRVLKMLESLLLACDSFSFLGNYLES